MTITRVSSASAQANNVAISTPQRGDIIVVFAHRDGSTTAPSLITGYTSIASSSGTSNSGRLMWKRCNGTETNTGTATNATSIACIIYRGADRVVPAGAYTAGGATSATIAYNAITPFEAQDGSSWVAGFAAHRTATNVGQAPSGMALQTSATDIAGSDTNGGVSSWSTQTVGVNASSGWRSYVCEIVARQATVPSPDPLVQYSRWRSNKDAETGNAFKFVLPNKVLAGNCIVVTLTYPYSAGRTVSIVDDKSNTYTAGPVANDTGNGFTSKMYYALNAVADTQNFTITFDTALYDVIVAIAEYTGVKTSAAADGTASNAAATDPLIQTGAFTPTANGDLIIQYAFASSVGPGLGLSNMNGFTAGPGWTLLAACREVAVVEQYMVQATAAEINPTVRAKVGTAANTWTTIALALKYDGSGTARPTTGIRIVSVFHTMQATATTDIVYFPSQGNLIVPCTCYGTGQATFNAPTDLKGNAYTRPTIPSLYPQLTYAAAAVGERDNAIITSLSGAYNMHLCIYDVINAHATVPYDTSANGTHTQEAPYEDAHDVPDITPTTANGLVIAVMNQGTGPSDHAVAAGQIFDNSHYTGQSDSSGTDDSGDGYSHVYNSDASQIAIGYGIENDGTLTTTVGFAVAFKAAASGVTLTVADGSHGHTAENIDLNQAHSLAVADGAHAHAAEAPVLAQVHSLSVADAAHAHAAEEPVLVQSQLLAPADALSAHAAEEPVLTQVHNLAPQDGTHGHVADNVDLAQAHVLAPGDAGHAHAAENVVLELAGTLVVQDSQHLHAAAEPALNQVHQLAAQDAAHAHGAESPALVQQHVLAPADAAHAHGAENVTLDVGLILAVQDAYHAHAADNVALVQQHLLAVADALHATLSDVLDLFQQHILVTQDGIHLLTSENVTLSELAAGYIAEFIIPVRGRTRIVEVAHRRRIIPVRGRTRIVEVERRI